MAASAAPVLLRKLEAERLDRRVAGAGRPTCATASPPCATSTSRSRPASPRSTRSPSGSRTGRSTVAAQDCFWEDKGAFTGEVAPSQLVDAGCKYVIVGHSERRQLFGELDAAVNLKARAALRAGLSPIICVGETLAERDAGETHRPRAGAAGRRPRRHRRRRPGARSSIAYEPVWAIGTGRNATPAQAQEVHRFIRTRVAARAAAVAPRLRILYGGSVKPDNIRALMAEADVDGGLVGGASLSAESFVRLVKRRLDAMTTFLTILHVFVCVFLILVVLLQAGKGGGMGIAFGGGGSQTVFGSSGAGNFLTRLTSITAVVFMVTSLGLAHYSSQQDSKRLQKLARRKKRPRRRPRTSASPS